MQTLQKDVSPSKSTSNSTPEDTYPMHLNKILTAGSILATGVTALKRPYSVELSQSHPDNESPIRRLRAVANGNLTTTLSDHPYILTVYDLIKNAVEQWSDKECLGSRKVVAKHEEQKNVTKVINGVETTVPKTWVYSELSPFDYRTYRDLGKESTSIGAGLRKLGLNPGDNVGLYADTSYISYFGINLVLNGKSLGKDVLLNLSP
jgi:hypothetical protein